MENLLLLNLFFEILYPNRGLFRVLINEQSVETCDGRTVVFFLSRVFWYHIHMDKLLLTSNNISLSRETCLPDMNQTGRIFNYFSQKLQFKENLNIIIN